MDTRRDRASQLQASNGPATGSTEGRRAPRLRVSGQIAGHVMQIDAPVNVVEIGLDGFSVESPIELPVGGVFEFKFTLHDGSDVYARGRVVHCRPQGSRNVPSRFVTGLAFVEETWRGRSTGDLIDDITSSILIL
jgi:hypothetical protein